MTNPIGYIAACLTVGSSVPQVYRILRTRNVYAISLPLYIMLFSGVILWFVYGLTIHALPVIISNFISAVLIGIILFLKLRLS